MASNVCSTVKTIVLHPGSHHLRIGLSSDNSPLILPHCIARKKKSQECSVATSDYHDISSWNPLPLPEAVSIADKIRNDIPEFSSICVPPEAKPFQDPLVPMEHIPSKSFYTDHEALAVVTKLPGDYFLHWPIYHGRLNPAASLSATIQDLHDIWFNTIRTHFGAVFKDMASARCILIIPDIFQRIHVRYLVEMLLKQMGFGSVMIHVKTMCASYASVIPTGCFVDVGHSCISITCLHDSSTVRHSRIELALGCRDLSAYIHQSIAPAYLPTLVPFFPQLFLSARSKEPMEFVTLPEREPVNQPDDPFEEYAKGKGGRRRGTNKGSAIKDQSAQNDARAPKAVPHADDDEESEEEEEDEGYSDEDKPGTKQMKQNEKASTVTNKALNTVEESEKQCVMSLDEAIVHSILHCRPDVIPNVTEVIVLIGGGAKLPGLLPILQMKLKLRIQSATLKSLASVQADNVKVLSGSHGIDPGDMAWKGATLICLVPCDDLWIDAKAWDAFGSRVIRERVPFVW